MKLYNESSFATCNCSCRFSVSTTTYWTYIAETIEVSKCILVDFLACV